MSQSIPIKSPIRQGCNLQNTINETLTGIKFGRQNQPTSVIAYAEDISVCLTSTEDIKKLEYVLQIYGQATGA
jgi:hypothetical protein